MKRLLTLIFNEQVIFTEPLERGGMRLLASLPLSEVLESGLSAPVRARLQGREHQLLLVPDYWLGIKSFPLATSRTGLVHSFIRKKLELELGEGQGNEEFFDYLPYIGDDGEKGITVYYSHEPHLATFHAVLAREQLAPQKVATPGLVWEEKLRQCLPQFAGGGKLLIYVAGDECSFFFFHQGRFLFSRDLGLPAGIDPSEKATLLGYEIQQSRFLFSQKARTELDQVFFVSARSAAVDLGVLAERVGREVLPLDPLLPPAFDLDPSALINPLLRFSPADWGRKSRLINFTHRRLRTEFDWKPAQQLAIACAAIAFLLLGGQAVLLGIRLSDAEFRQRNQTIREKSTLLREFSGRLDQIIQRRQLPSATNALVQLANSLPENVMIEGFTVDVATEKKLRFNGLASAEGPEAFRATLITLAGQLRALFPGNEQFTYRDIQFVIERSDEEQPLTRFKISFAVAL